MRVLNLLCAGGIGGIETLSLNYSKHSKHTNSYVVLWKPGPISDEMKDIGIDVDVFDTRPIKYFSDFFKLLKKCKKQKIEVLVCHQGGPRITRYIRWLHFFLPKMKIVGYVHSNPIDWGKKSIKRRQKLCKHVSKIVCISDNVLESVVRVMNNREKLVRIYNGVDIKELSGAKRNEPNDTLKLIYVGRLIPQKGVDNILKNMVLFDDSMNISLKIVGDGPERSKLEAMVKELGIADKVEFLGKRRDIPSLLADSDVFVHLPNWQEGFGITVAEALAAGLICVVNDHGAMPEIIRHGIDGFVASRATNLKFRDAIQDIYNNIIIKGDNMEEIRQNAIKRSQDFSIEEYTRQMDMLIEDVLI